MVFSVKHWKKYVPNRDKNLIILEKEMTWQEATLVLGSVITICLTLYKFISLGQTRKNGNGAGPCSDHSQKLALLAQEMDTRNKNFDTLCTRFDLFEQRVHADIGKTWAGIDNLKDLIIKGVQNG
jgi:hypothetical protein